MDGITFASTPLAEVARRVVVEYLGTASGEAFLLVTDDGVAPELADALIAAAAAAGADPTHARIAARERSGEEPPPPVVGAMAAADVCLCVATRSIYHTAAKGRAQAAGTRGCFNAPAIWAPGRRAR